MSLSIKTYNTLLDLSPDQKSSCDEVWRRAVSSLPGANLNDRLVEKFWQLVFRYGWTSDKPVAIPTQRHRYGGESMVKAGVFTRDLPTAPGQITPLERRKNQPAYLGVNIHRVEGPPYFTWTDYRGHSTSRDFVKLSSDEEMLRYRAMRRHDRAEKARLMEWNTELAVCIVRRRIVMWSTQGFPTAVEGERERLYMFVDTVLCQEYLRMCKQRLAASVPGTTANQYRPRTREWKI